MEDERDRGKEEEERLCLVFHPEQEEHFTNAVYRSHNGVSLAVWLSFSLLFAHSATQYMH